MVQILWAKGQNEPPHLPDIILQVGRVPQKPSRLPWETAFLLVDSKGNPSQPKTETNVQPKYVMVGGSNQTLPNIRETTPFSKKENKNKETPLATGVLIQNCLKARRFRPCHSVGVQGDEHKNPARSSGSVVKNFQGILVSLFLGPPFFGVHNMPVYYVLYPFCMCLFLAPFLRTQLYLFCCPPPFFGGTQTHTVCRTFCWVSSTLRRRALDFPISRNLLPGSTETIATS